MRYRIRRRNLTPIQRKRQETRDKLYTQAEIQETGVAEKLKRIWEPYELDICIDALSIARGYREEAERLESPKKRKVGNK